MSKRAKFRGIKTAAEYRRGELTKDILKVIGAGVVLGGVIVSPGLAQVIDYFNPKGVEERKRLWRAIKYLERKNSITIIEKNGHEVVEITNGGQIALNEQAIMDLEIGKPMYWDHRWRLVMFDVPGGIARSGARDALRYKL